MSTVSMLFGSRSQQGGGTTVPFTPTPVEVLLQEKNVDPSGDPVVVIADSGYDGLSKVTVNAVNARGIKLDVIDLKGRTIYPSEFDATFFSSVKVPVVRLQTPYRLTAQTLMSALSHGGEPTIDPDSGYTGMSYIQINHDDFAWGSPAYKSSSGTYGIGFGIDSFSGYYDETNTYHAFSGSKKLFYVTPPYPLYATDYTKIAGDAELLGNANANCVLNTVSFTSQDGIHIQGTLEDMSYDAVDIPSLQGYKQYWPGYYNKGWTVTSWKPTDANAHPEDVLEGKSYYANKVGSSTQYYRIGTMKNYAFKEPYSSTFCLAYSRLYYENGSFYGRLFYNPYDADDCLEIRSFDNLYVGAVPSDPDDHIIGADPGITGYISSTTICFEGKYKIKYNVNAIVNSYDTRQFIAKESDGIIGSGLGYMQVSYYYNQTDVYKQLSRPTNFFYVRPPRTTIYNSLYDHILLAAEPFGNAWDSAVLWGVTYTSEQGVRRTGTMWDQSDLAVDTVIEEPKTFYRGYYNQNWTVTPYSVIEGNATIWDVLEGKTFITKVSDKWDRREGVVSNYKNTTVRGLTCNYEGQIGTLDYHGLYNMYYNSNGDFLGYLNHDRVYEISSDMGVISIGLPPSEMYYKVNILNTDRQSLYTIGMVDNNSIIQLESGVKIKAKAPTGTATASRVLSGYTFSNESGFGYSGSMQNYGRLDATLSPLTSGTTSVSLFPGYYTGGTIQTAIVTGTVDKFHVIEGYTFSNSSGLGYTGAITNAGDLSINVGNLEINYPDQPDEPIPVTGTYVKLNKIGNHEFAFSDIASPVIPPSGAFVNSLRIIGSPYYTINVWPDSSDGTATSDQVLSGYTFSNYSGLGYSGTMVNRGSLTVSVAPSSQRSIPAGYYTGGTIIGQDISLQAITQTIDPSVASWGSRNTDNFSFTPGSGYYALASVTVNVPFLRDGTLLSVGGVSSISTVYIGDEAQTGSGNYLRVSPTKNGYSKTGSYLYIAPSSSMGNATAADVLAGKTFSSAAGIQVTGTGSAPSAKLQAITRTIDPSVSWSAQNTSDYSFTPSSGYDGLSSVTVNVPFLRDGTLLTVSTVTSMSTVYNGDTAQSVSGKFLRVSPTKNGYSKTGSYLYVGPSSSMGDATAEDVAYGKTFSSLSGIQVTGTGTVVKRALKTIWKNPNCVRHSTTTTSSVKHYYIQNSSYSFAAQTININSYSILIDGARLRDLLYSKIGYFIIEYQYDDRLRGSTEGGKTAIRSKIEIISVAEFFGYSLDRNAYGVPEGYIILSGYDTSYGDEMGRLVYTTSTPGASSSNFYISFSLAYQVRSYDDGNGSPDAAIPLRIWYSQYFPSVDVRELADV